MKLIEEINILTNKKLVWGLNITALVLMLPFGFLFTFIAVITATLITGGAIGQSADLSIFLLLPLYIVLIVIHELIHGLFFKLFCPQNQVKFGIKLKSGMAYATSPGSLYNRKQMLVIALAPFVLISLGLLACYALGLLSEASFILIATMHAVSCVGDFYYAYLLLIKYRKQAIRVEDTPTGLMIYQAA